MGRRKIKGGEGEGLPALANKKMNGMQRNSPSHPEMSRENCTVRPNIRKGTNKFNSTSIQSLYAAKLKNNNCPQRTMATFSEETKEQGWAIRGS